MRRCDGLGLCLTFMIQEGYWIASYVGPDKINNWVKGKTGSHPKCGEEQWAQENMWWRWEVNKIDGREAFKTTASGLACLATGVSTLILIHPCHLDVNSRWRFLFPSLTEGGRNQFALTTTNSFDYTCTYTFFLKFSC